MGFTSVRCVNSPRPFMFGNKVLICLNSHFLCSQVSTSTGVLSHAASLQVIVPEAFILGSGELHVDMGSALNLVCIIEKVTNKTWNYKQVSLIHIIIFQSPTPPQYVYWQRNSHMINYDDSRRDITIETSPGPRTQSRLIIQEVMKIWINYSPYCFLFWI